MLSTLRTAVLLASLKSHEIGKNVFPLTTQGTEEQRDYAVGPVYLMRGQRSWHLALVLPVPKPDFPECKCSTRRHSSARASAEDGSGRGHPSINHIGPWNLNIYSCAQSLGDQTVFFVATLCSGEDFMDKDTEWESRERYKHKQKT